MAEVFGTLSVRVGASRTVAQRHAERGRRDLDHLGVQALAHLGAAVVDQHRAVLVHVHQRAGLVERGQVERDAELDRGDRQPALGVRVGGVERGDLGLAARRSRCARSPATRSPPAARRAAPAGRTGWPGRARRSSGAAARPARPRAAGAQRPRMSSMTIMPCGPPKPRNAVFDGRLVLAIRPVHLDVGDPVGVVDVAQRPGQHRLGQVQAPAAVAGQRGAQRAQPLVRVEAHLPGGEERVPLAGHGDVLGAVQPQAHRVPGEGRRRARRPRPARAAGTPCRRSRRPSAGTAR